MKVFSPSPPMADAARDFKGPAEIVFTRMPYLSHTAWGTQVSKTYALYIRCLAQSKMSSKDKSPMCRQRHLRPALETGQNMNREKCMYSSRNISQHIATSPKDLVGQCASVWLELRLSMCTTITVASGSSASWNTYTVYDDGVRDYAKICTTP